MKNKQLFLLLLVILLGNNMLFSQPVNRKKKTQQYKELQKKFCTGWNTWYNNSVVSHVRLPEGFSINLGFEERGGAEGWRDITDYQEGIVTLGLRSDNGDYTSLKIKYKDIEYEVQSATDGEDQLILISPAKPSNMQLVLETGILWDKEGTIGVENNKFIAKFPSRTITVNSTEQPVPDAYAISTSMHLTIPLKKEVGIYTGKSRSLENIKGIFLNKHLDTGEKPYRISPTNFYPLLAKAATQEQAEILINKHYFNSDEFYDQYVMPSIARIDPAFGEYYWRGDIWPPLNFLVYLGMKNYNLPEARKDLVERSMKLMMKTWSEKRIVCERYSHTTGIGNGPFYHWGALLGFMSFIEAGYIEPPLI
jgi:hypothetical protein